MSIRKRSWETKDGPQEAWIVDYKDQQGTRRLKTFKRKKDATSWWEGQTAYQIQQGTHTPESQSITVAEAADNWIKKVKLDGRERSTVTQYEQHIELHIKPRLRDVKLAKLTKPGIEHFCDHLLGSLSRPMAKKVLTSLKAILKDAQRRGNVAQNVASDVNIEMGKRHTRPIEVGVDVPTPDEIRLMLATVKGRWRPFFVTAIFTGMRASELRGLTWDHVDFEANVIRVRQRADKWCQLGDPKSHAGTRDIPMLSMVVNTLKEWRLQCPKGELGLVFPSQTGRIQSQPPIYRSGLEPLQKAAGIVDEDGRPKYGMHSLRHFFASWLISEGFKAKRIQQLMGHQSIKMTFDVYGHWFLDEEDEAERLAAAELKLVGVTS